MKESRQAELGLLEKKKLSLPDEMVSDALANSPNGKASFEQMVSAYKVPLQYRQKVNFRKVIVGIAKKWRILRQNNDNINPHGKSDQFVIRLNLAKMAECREKLRVKIYSLRSAILGKI